MPTFGRRVRAVDMTAIHTSDSLGYAVIGLGAILSFAAIVLCAMRQR